jgi:predicted enzyme related to lactoylglutathione lyase
MATDRNYPAGVPCWVETFQPDPSGAEEFYGPLLGWTFTGNDAWSDGRLVAGISPAPPGVPALWATFVAVDDLADAFTRIQAAGGSVLAGPTPRGAAGQYGIVTDPTGVAFGVWEAADRAGAEVVGSPNAWAMSSLHSPDTAVAKSFYGGVFGWELEPGPDFSRWRLGDRLVAVLSGTGPGVPPHWAVAFAVEDPDGIAASATQRGGSLLMAPTDTPGFRSAVIRDPQGGVFAVTTPRTG